MAHPQSVRCSEVLLYTLRIRTPSTYINLLHFVFYTHNLINNLTLLVQLMLSSLKRTKLDKMGTKQFHLVVHIYNLMFVFILG